MNDTKDQAGTATKTKWTLDPAHSEISFKVKHMMISNVTGHLTDYAVEVESRDEAFSHADVTFVGKLASLTTNNEQRDTHLRSADFFDIENTPDIVFKSTNYVVNDDEVTLEGDITIRGVTKPIVLDVDFGGIQKDPYGNTKAGFSVRGKLNRKDFGLNWNTALETGGVLVGDEVKINCEIQLIKSEK
jgi:polyisoprenoid-binding protein YceI